LKKGIARKMEKRELAKVFKDRLTPGDWRVEWEDEDGGVEVTIFSGADAREPAAIIPLTNLYLLASIS
jgi:hypothetical protein